ncbi:MULTISPECIES: DUF7344 domain-containing protein [Halorussus]|uniref:DUF7344 domain-containing protein n=1 Tax=Halorussus TaxID=1070314 RepID=UPI00209ECC11|nr:hypothetical protein [Halorussus vallis]USZ76962.1 hypothetical protein NGM07_06430 [Halorussus vallis]
MSAIGDSSGAGSSDSDETTGQQGNTVATKQVADVTDAESETEEVADLSRDLVFDVLKNRRRRYALHYLRRAEETVQLSELAEQVAAWENDTTIDAISAAERKRVYTALYQSHLPKLDDAGIVDYNQNRGIVELSGAAEQLDVYLDLDAKPDIAWSNWYLGLAVGGIGLLSAAWLGLPPAALMGDVLVAALIVVAYAAVAVAHTYYSRHASTSAEAPPEIQES